MTAYINFRREVLIFLTTSFLILIGILIAIFYTIRQCAASTKGLLWAIVR
jgi:CHASE3 domain sensor protein